jgi:hypothetical protein
MFRGSRWSVRDAAIGRSRAIPRTMMARARTLMRVSVPWRLIIVVIVAAVVIGGIIAPIVIIVIIV